MTKNALPPDAWAQHGEHGPDIEADRRTLGGISRIECIWYAVAVALSIAASFLFPGPWGG